MNSVEIEAVKVGDRVGVTRPYGQAPIVTTVTRRTKTQIITASNERFNKNGRSLGGSPYSRSYLIAVADAEERIKESRAIREHNQLLNTLRNFPWGKLDGDALAQIKTLAESLLPVKEAA